MNQISIHRRALAYYVGLDTWHGFQTQLFSHALDRYQELFGQDGLGRVLVICGSATDAAFVTPYPFEEIVITGLGDQREAVMEAAAHDPRVRYQEENAEAVTFADRSFDLVFCKFGLHHLVRPPLGLYEMLRCCRRAAIFIEPYDSLARRILELMGLSSVYEHRQRNPGLRDNHVYPFKRRDLIHLLNSYYLDSGYRLELHFGWYSGRAHWRAAAWLSTLAAYAGWLLQYVPGAEGNLLTAVICPGKDLPRPVFRLGPNHTVTDLGL